MCDRENDSFAEEQSTKCGTVQESRNRDLENRIRMNPVLSAEVTAQERFSSEYIDARNNLCRELSLILKLPYSNFLSDEKLDHDRKKKKEGSLSALTNEQEIRLTAFTDAFGSALRGYNPDKGDFIRYFNTIYDQKKRELYLEKEQEKRGWPFTETVKDDRTLIRAIARILHEMGEFPSDLQLKDSDYEIIRARLNAGRAKPVSLKRIRTLIECLVITYGTVSLDDNASGAAERYSRRTEWADPASEDGSEAFEEFPESDYILYLFDFLNSVEKKRYRNDYILVFDKILMKKLKQYDYHKDPFLNKAYEKWTGPQKEHIKFRELLEEVQVELFEEKYLIVPYLFYVLLPEPDRIEELDSIANIDGSGYRNDRRFSNESIADYETGVGERRTKAVIEKRGKEALRLIRQYLEALKEVKSRGNI